MKQIYIKINLQNVIEHTNQPLYFPAMENSIVDTDNDLNNGNINIQQSLTVQLRKKFGCEPLTGIHQPYPVNKSRNMINSTNRVFFHEDFLK